MKFGFSREHSKFNRSMLNIDPDKDMSEDEQLILEDALAEHLQTHGLDENGEENDEGMICADILTLFAHND